MCCRSRRRLTHQQTTATRSMSDQDADSDSGSGSSTYEEQQQALPKGTIVEIVATRTPSTAGMLGLRGVVETSNESYATIMVSSWQEPQHIIRSCVQGAAAKL